MIPFLRWLLHGEDVVRRVLLTGLAGTSYVVGAGWRPEDPVWIAGGLGCCLAAAASRPNAKPLDSRRPAP